ncbi:MAG: MFS transporter, partial [Acidimicrobiaceae bacterium]|nr:MFS transporter [Acidimicrobiaceae bacterium]
MSSPHPRPRTRRAPDWLILTIACVAQFMVVLDVSVVNVALPSIRSHLHYSPTGLQWVVNAYVLTFAGFLLLGGRVADLLGSRRVFVFGLGVFSLASLVGGFSTSPGMLTAARAVQGLGGAVLAPVTLTVIMTTFPEGPARTRALGAWSAVAGGGGGVGVLLGGILTTYLSWRWVLFINVPIGLVLGVAAGRYLSNWRRPSPGQLDVAGAVTVTAGLAALVYAIVGTDTHPWGSAHTLGFLAAAAVLIGAFLAIEARFAGTPLMPLRLFRSRSLSAANSTQLLFGGAFFAMWYFVSLYLQDVHGYDALTSGLAFFPMCVGIVVGARITIKLVSRFGPRSVLLFGLPLCAIGFLWFSRLRVASGYLSGVFGPGVLISLGLGLCVTPIAAAATSGVAEHEAGLASGVVTTSRQVGGSIGLAVLATLATLHTDDLMRVGRASIPALAAGYDRAFLVSAGFILAATACAALIPARRRPVVGPPQA